MPVLMKLLYRYSLSSLLFYFSFAVHAQQYGSIERRDPFFNSLIASDTAIEKIAGGFQFVEGPVWVQSDNYLAFSDIPANKIHKWDPETKQVSVLLEPSGFTGEDASGIGREVNERGETFYNIGSNGMTVDADGRLVFNAMGDRQIVRIEPDGKRTTLASHYQGKRLNSTNDLVFRSDGTLYFTDPPSGLRGGDDDPAKQLDFNGVFMLQGRDLKLLTKDIHHPNGIAFSHDEKILYVNDNRARRITAFDVKQDGTIARPRVFVDMADDPAAGNPDGMKVDVAGTIYAAGAGGVWVITPEGELLGRIMLPERASNMAFGDEDGKSLYITARTSIYRVRLLQPGKLEGKLLP